MVTEEWLERANRELREKGVEPPARPWLAIETYAAEMKSAIAFNSPEATAIFQWFIENSGPGAHQIWPLFTGAYYFDSCFWPVPVYPGFGMVRVDPLDFLETMPANLKKDLWAFRSHACGYSLLWADCIDYGYGLDDLLLDGSGLDPYGVRLLRSGSGELDSVIAQICQARPNTKSMMSARMAVEMFLKALICLKGGLTDKEARKLGHDLHAAIEKCIAITDSEELKAIQKELDIFPAIHERYEGESKPAAEIWRAYSVAQFLASSVVRMLTDRNVKAQVLSSLTA